MFGILNYPMKSSEIRTQFINFFQEKNHHFVPGSPTVPDNDPTLLFINAGMNQFKDVFLGAGKRDYKRAVNSQVCVRVSGKHNDLEDVGNDSTHLTSFEMLGNWSFGDYYKKEAIAWAWELLTSTLKISKEKLVATVFEDDEESLALWKSETDINHQRIVKCDAKDNFWEMGSTGPCGPCSEIHVYLKDEPLPEFIDQDLINSGDFIELWNLVFIQYNRLGSVDLKKLPQCHVDTGAGLERITAYLQGTPSNYQTDLFEPLISKIASLSGVTYYENSQGMPHRVMADHIRTLVFGIADNVMLSNEGRGYVLRRLLRRACRYAKQLGFDEAVLYRLVETVVETLGDAYPHLRQRQAHIQHVIKAEEESFLQTLHTGLQLFESVAEHSKHTKVISGDDAFKLYDTFGFPVDLTSVLAKEQQLTVDLERFNVLLDEQRERSRAASKFDQGTQENTKKVSPELFNDVDLHLSEDLNTAKGGEARVISDPKEKVAMARHHTATHLLHELLRRTLGDHVHQAGSLVDSDRLRFDFSHFEKVSETSLAQIEAGINDFIRQSLRIDISFEMLETAKKRGVMALFGEKYDPQRVRVVDIGGESVELCAGTHVKNTNDVGYVKIISEGAISAGTRRIEALAGKECVGRYLAERISFFCKEIEQHIHVCQAHQELLKSKNLVTQFMSINDIFKQQSLVTEIQDQENYLELLDQAQSDIKEIVKKIKKELEKKEKNQSSDLIDTLINNTEAMPGKQGAFIIKKLDAISMANLRHVSEQLTTKKANLITFLTTVSDDKAIVLITSNLDDKAYDARKLITQITQKFGGGGGGKSRMAQAGGIKRENIDSMINFVRELLTQ